MKLICSILAKNVRLPPKKTRPTPRTLNATAVEQQSSLASLQPRSPLSPLHPSSPLFPDGLIAPIWLRKHRELVPSVFVSFYCLAEQPPDAAKEAPGTEQTGTLAGAELKRKDEDLIRVISDRKRALSERGIKFTVVLLTTRSMLDSPSLESRLSYIRRSSQLDSKASLFVLTPVSRSELGEFVTSLQTALYESALDYYREHYRKAKKKRSRYPPPASTVSQIMSAATEIRGNPIKDSPLSKEGWLARNEYKLGTFAEMTCNLNEALTHYTGAYQILVNELLASTMLLPPRTKRWAEAKVLSDCLSFKISRIHLYRNDGDGAWDQFKVHLKRFTELSQGWGIGEITLEFWSWLGKQYRLMGDLLDLATKEIPGSPLPSFQVASHFPDMPTFLLHPSHLPTPTINGYTTPSHNPQHGSLVVPNELALIAHIVPSDMCQGAGACFYLAGICAMERWQRFRKMVWQEENDVSKKENAAWASLMQERKVDHAGQAIEVFTRAHEVYKRSKQERQSLLVASKIAIVYVEGKQHEMALQFLERIIKTYRAEGWPTQSVSLLFLSLQCSQHTKSAESEGRALWSLLSPQCPISTTQRPVVLDALQRWQERPRAEGAKMVTNESSGSDGIVLVEVAFSQDHINLEEGGVLYQIRLTCPPGHSLPNVHFDSLVVYFTGNATAFVIKHDNDNRGSTSSLVNLATISLDTIDDRLEVGRVDLRWWADDTVRTLQGTVIPNKMGVLQVEKVCLLGKGACDFTLDFRMTGLEEAHFDPVQPRWMTSAAPLTFVDLTHREDRDGVLVNKRSHKVRVDLAHDREAYLEEIFVIEVKIHNEETFALQCLAEVTVLSAAGEGSHDLVWLQQGQPKQAGRLEETELGVIQGGTSATYRIILQCMQSVLARDVEIRIKTVIPGDFTEGRNDEMVQILNLPVRQLFVPAFQASWTLVRDSNLAVPPTLARKPSITVSDVDDGGSEGGSEITLSTHNEGEIRGMSSIAAINVGLSVLAKENILIHSVRLQLDEASKHLRFSHKAASSSCEWEKVDEVLSIGDRWGTVYDIEVLSETATGFAIEGDDGSLRPTGQLEIRWRRESSLDAESTNISLLDVPLLLPPTLLSRVMVSVPFSTVLEQPLVMLLSIVNPCKLPTEIFVVIDDAKSDFEVLSHKSFSVPLIAKSTRSVPIHVLFTVAASSQNATPSSSIRHLPKFRAWQRDRRMKKDAEGEGVEVAKPATAPFLAIMNQQRGGGIPLDVQLRYSKAPSSAPQHLQDSNGVTGHRSSVAQLQVETQKTGAWTVFAHSQADLAR